MGESVSGGDIIKTAVCRGYFFVLFDMMASSQQQNRLIKEATSHGPYLWSGTDIENALQWFSGSSEVDNEIIKTAAENEEGDGCLFLRLLLHACGIWNPRPQKRMKSSNKKLLLAAATADENNNDDNHNNRKRNKKKLKRNDAGSSSNGGGKDESNGCGSSTNIEELSPLQSVLMGYYLLFQKVTSSDNSLEDTTKNNSNNDDDDEGYDIGTATATKTLEASTKLYSDINSIILSRRHTHELYRASLHVAATNSVETAETTAISSMLSFQQQQQRQKEESSITGLMNNRRMTVMIDEYMVHPTTCARRVYAASIYDRLVNLATTNNNEDDDCSNHDYGGSNSTTFCNNGEETTVKDSKAVQKYLQKLFGLATNNAKIQEVILLLVLEPLRRLSIRQMIVKGGEEQHLMDLFPLLTSQILSSSAAAATNPSKEGGTKNDESSSPLINLLVKSILQTNLDTSWWSQPSPLLCTISQFHFPIARKYLHYWIERAIVTHESLYQDATTNANVVVSPPSKATNITSNQGETAGEDAEDKTTFHHAITRMQQFQQTSHRLCSFLSHVLRNLEDEIKMSQQHGGLIDEEEEVEVFRTSLALKAIKRALEE